MAIVWFSVCSRHPKYSSRDLHCPIPLYIPSGELHVVAKPPNLMYRNITPVERSKQLSHLRRKVPDQYGGRISRLWFYFELTSYKEHLLLLLYCLYSPTEMLAHVLIN